MFETTAIKRRPDGSIDAEHYAAIGRVRRSHAFTESLRMVGGFVSRGPMPRGRG